MFKRKFGAWLWLLAIVAIVMLPTMAMAAEATTTPVISQETRAQAWIQVVILALGIVLAVLEIRKAKLKEGKSLRLQDLKSLIPAAHNLAQKASLATETRKDELFIARLEKLAKDLFGYELAAAEEKPLKMLGEAYHQDFKIARGAADPIVIEEAGSMAVLSENPPMSSASS